MVMEKYYYIFHKNLMWKGNTFSDYNPNSYIFIVIKHLIGNYGFKFFCF